MTGWTLFSTVARPAMSSATAVRFTETVLVGAMADRFAGRWLEWDGASQTFHDAAATALVRRAYRGLVGKWKGWDDGHY